MDKNPQIWPIFDVFDWISGKYRVPNTFMDIT